MSGANGFAARPRLLVLTSTYPRWEGDPEPGFVHELARRLNGKFEVTVLGPHAPDALHDQCMDGVRVHRYRYAPAWLETLVNDGGIVTNLKRHRWKWLLVPGFLVGQLWALWRLNRRWRPDVIHAHWLLPQGLAVALLSTFDRAMPPFLVTSHGADLFALRARSLQWLKRWVIRRAAAVTVVSSAMRDELVRIGADIDKVSVQPMGVDLAQRFTPDATVQRSADEILFVGRLVEKKGLRHLIDAMPAILASHPGAFLTVVGFGPEEAERRAQAARLGLADKVGFAGAVAQAELPARYRRAAVFVAPFVEAADGDQEGLGLVLVEALACDCPVVTTRLPAVREVFGGQWPAHAVAPGSAAALADGVCSALADPGAWCDQTIRERGGLSRFDWDRVAEGYARVLDRARRRQS